MKRLWWKTEGTAPFFQRWGAFAPSDWPDEQRTDDMMGMEVVADVSLAGWRLEDGAGY